MASKALSAAIVVYNRAAADPHGGKRLLTNARTNWVRNGVLSGSSPGSPGALPVNWVVGGAAVGNGITQTIGALGFDSERIYLPIRFAGTVTAFQFNNFFMEGPGQVAAAIGQTWTAGFDVRLAAGSVTNAGLTVNVFGRRADTGNVEAVQVAITPTATWQRVSSTITLADPTSVFATLALGLGPSTNLAVDVTLWLAKPQLEKWNAPTEYIDTNGAAASAGATASGSVSATITRSRALQAAAGAAGTIAGAITRSRAVQVAMMASVAVTSSLNATRAMRAAASVSASIGAAAARSRALATAETVAVIEMAVNTRTRIVVTALTVSATLSAVLTRSRPLSAASGVTGAVAANVRRAKGLQIALRAATTLYAFARGGTYVPAEHQFFAVPVRRDFVAPADRRITGPELPAFTAKGVMDNARYSYDFTLALATGDTVLATPAPTVTEATGTLTIGAPVLLGSVVMARISGGVAGTIYRVVWTCATAAGDRLSRTTPIAVENR